MGEGLLRQRRNLITTCVLLWIMKYGGITFTKFSLAGFDVALKNPDSLTVAIWIAFSYFLYRYYQYFSDEGVSKLHGVFSSALENRCEPAIREYVMKEYPTNKEPIRYSYMILKVNGWVYRGRTLGGYEPTTGQVNDEQFEIKIDRWMLRKVIFIALMDSIFRNSVVTDYLLPFALAGGVLFYCGSNDWSGSFLHA